MAIRHLHLEIQFPIKSKYANTQQLIFCPCLPSQYLENKFLTLSFPLFSCQLCYQFKPTDTSFSALQGISTGSVPTSRNRRHLRMYPFAHFALSRRILKPLPILNTGKSLVAAWRNWEFSFQFASDGVSHFTCLSLGSPSGKQEA